MMQVISNQWLTSICGDASHHHGYSFEPGMDNITIYCGNGEQAGDAYIINLKTGVATHQANSATHVLSTDELEQIRRHVDEHKDAKRVFVNRCDDCDEYGFECNMSGLPNREGGLFTSVNCARSRRCDYGGVIKVDDVIKPTKLFEDESESDGPTQDEIAAMEAQWFSGDWD